MERVKTGILGLDQIIDGGFPKGSSILVTGSAGTGKTIFGLQYLYRGAKNQKEAGILVQAEEFDQTLSWYSDEFGWDLGKLQELGLLAIFSFNPKDYGRFMPHTIDGDVLRKLEAIMNSIGAKRLVVDSITPISLAIKDVSDYRYSLYLFLNFLKKKGVTSILVAEEKTRKVTKFGVEDHLVDGIIRTRKVEMEDGTVIVEAKVEKMIGTDFVEKWYPIKINPKIGFSFKPF